MPKLESSPPYEHGLTESLGILLVNLGTPDEPTAGSVRRFLNRFLSDRRVVEAPRLIWWPVLHGFILRFRPSRSAQAYQQIWTENGSPLLLHSQDIREALGARLAADVPGSVHVEIGMSYGNPSIGTALSNLYARNVRRLVVLPMYPQYSSTTTGSVFCEVTAALSRRRWIPDLRFIGDYHHTSGYISALAASVREHWKSHGRGERLLFSFHGLPVQMRTDGDPYHCQCQKTARLLADALELGSDDWSVCFQSQVGRDEWLQPYTDETLKTWGESGGGNIDVICPGFSVDCLETLEEVALRYAEVYAKSGGGELRYIPALNDRDDHISFLSQLVEENISGWPESLAERNSAVVAKELQESADRAQEMGARNLVGK
jgi:ferrochelatase